MASCGCSPVVVVVPGDHLADARAVAAGRREVLVAAGGNSRQASVSSGLTEVAAGRVVVHDAARPLARRVDVTGVLAALEDAHGAIVAVPVDETLKRVGGGRVRATIDRSELWRAQTPQAFRTARLRDSHLRAQQEGYEATDDAALVERYGGSVAVVEGSRTNIKLTYAEDFELAEAIFRDRWP
jgi:2-C-methyl-D-erythritol 4-phosphate cytidylyltransferase